MSVETVSAAARQWPAVSVVIPTRDRPDQLRQAVQAVIDQDYPGQIEIVIVFDQTEPTAPNVPEEPGRRIRLTVNDRSPGLAGARNTGISAAEGDVIAFCDDDDVWRKEKLSRQIGLLEQRPDASVVATGMTVHFQGRAVPRLPGSQEVTLRDLLLSRRSELHPSSFLSRRDQLQRIGLIDETLPGSYGEDYEWLLRAARVGPIVAVPEALVDVYWHRASWFAQRWGTIIASLSHLLERYPEFADEPRGLARIRGQIAFASAAAGQRAAARVWARRCLQANWREPRAYLALLVSLGILRADRVLALTHRFGKGI